MVVTRSSHRSPELFFFRLHRKINRITQAFFFFFRPDDSASARCCALSILWADADVPRSVECAAALRRPCQQREQPCAVGVIDRRAIDGVGMEGISSMPQTDPCFRRSSSSPGVVRGCAGSAWCRSKTQERLATRSCGLCWFRPVT